MAERTTPEGRTIRVHRARGTCYCGGLEEPDPNDECWRCQGTFHVINRLGCKDHCPKCFPVAESY